MRCNYLANASDQVSVRREATAREKRLQLRHKRVKLAD